jgi:hypothetical protein
VTAPPNPPRDRPGSRSRKREPMTLDLKATKVETRPVEQPAASSLTDDPRTPEQPPETENAAAPSLVDDPRPPDATPHPTPSEIEAAVAQLAPEAAAGPIGEANAGPTASEGSTPIGDVPPTQDIGEAPPPELAPGPLATDRSTDATAEPAAAMPAAADRLDDRPSSAPTRVEESPHRRGAGFGAFLAASLIGGVAGAALAVAAERFWLRPADPFTARIAQLEQRLGSGPSPDLGAIERRLSTLENQQREQDERIQSTQSAADQTAKRVDEAVNRAAAGVASPAGQPVASIDPAVLEPVNARIAALETELRTQGQEASRQTEQRSQQTKQLEALAAQVRALGQGLDSTTSQSTERAQQVAAVAQQVGQLNERLEALQKQFSERGPETTAGLRVVAADRVLDALRDGAPFPQALAALKRLNVDPQRLAALEPFAHTGAPTAAALAQEFRPIGERMIAAARGPATSWSDRFARMAEGIVTVRPLGDPQSNSVPDLVARIQNSLNRGAVADAAAAWDALPEPSRRLAEEFGRKLKSRAAAEDAARTLSNQALAALDASSR